MSSEMGGDARRERTARRSAPTRKPKARSAAGTRAAPKRKTVKAASTEADGSERASTRKKAAKSATGSGTGTETGTAATASKPRAKRAVSKSAEAAAAPPEKTAKAARPSGAARKVAAARAKAKKPAEPTQQAEPAQQEEAPAAAPAAAAPAEAQPGAERPSVPPGPRVDWCARVGELVVYPGQGVARISEFGVKQIGGADCEFLVLSMIGGASRIMIPVGKVQDVGLRPLMGSEEVQRIWKILRSRPQGRSGRQTWIRQFREYQDRIKTGTVFDIAEVLRNLLLLQKEKELSFGEHRVLDSARTLLAEELAAVENRSMEDILTEIKQLARA